jgi:hypothetical protein
MPLVNENKNVIEIKDESIKDKQTEIYERLISQLNWLDTTCKTLNIKGATADECRAVLSHKIKDFLFYCGSIGKLNRSDTEIKGHFINYSRKQS